MQVDCETTSFEGDTMKITVLTENTTASDACVAEFGLSLLVEANGRTVLFDSGQTGIIVPNADALGIDLAAVDAAVLSHGHFDHANGFPAFFERNETARLYVHEGYDKPHMKDDEYIGVVPELIGNDRVVIADDRYELGDGFTIVSYAGVDPAFPIDSAGLDEGEGPDRRPDQFAHEHYLIVEEGDVRVLISGCSHRGIRNIMRWSAGEGLTHVMGGFHLMGVPVDGGALEEIADELLAYPVDYASCHCTGLDQYRRLKELMGERIRYMAAGDMIEL